MSGDVVAAEVACRRVAVCLCGVAVHLQHRYCGGLLVRLQVDRFAKVIQ
jgi:hypothetical protein